jgi:hypothetical protein
LPRLRARASANQKQYSEYLKGFGIALRDEFSHAYDATYSQKLLRWVAPGFPFIKRQEVFELSFSSFVSNDVD